MWNNIIFIDYDVGSFGNTILSFLVTTSTSPAGAIEYESLFSSRGDGHAVRRKYQYSHYEYQLLSGKIPELATDLKEITQYIPIIGHSYGKIDWLMSNYPGANLIKINIDRQSFAVAFLAGYNKFMGFPTIDTMDKFYQTSWSQFDHTELGMIECLALNFYDYIKLVDWKYYPNAIVISLTEIINTEFYNIIKLFQQQFKFEFNHELVVDFIKNWKKTNQTYFDQGALIENIVSGITHKQSVDISKFNLACHDKAMIVAFVCYDLNIDIYQFPYTDLYQLAWTSTDQLIELIYKHYTI